MNGRIAKKRVFRGTENRTTFFSATEKKHTNSVALKKKLFGTEKKTIFSVALKKNPFSTEKKTTPLSSNSVKHDYINT